MCSSTTSTSPYLTLTGNTIHLKEFSKKHLDDERYFLWLRDLEVVLGIYRLEYLLPLEHSKIKEYARGLLSSETDFYFAIHLNSDDRFVGTIKIGHIDWRTGTADLGVLVGDKSYWGKGLATDACSTVCQYAFSTLSLRKITGGTAANNHGMIRCFERLGFQSEAVLRKKLLIDGEFVDHILFGLFKDEFVSTEKDS